MKAKYGVEITSSKRFPGMRLYRYYFTDPVSGRAIQARFRAPQDEPRDPTMRPGCREGDAWVQGQLNAALNAATEAATGATADASAPVRRTDLQYWADEYLRRHRARVGIKTSVYVKDVQQYVSRVMLEAGITDLAQHDAGKRLYAFLGSMKRLRNGKQPKAHGLMRQVTTKSASAGTKNHYLKTLQSISDMAYRQGHLPRDPFVGLDAFRGDQPETYCYSVADLRRIVSDEMYTYAEHGPDVGLRGAFYFCVLAAYTGLRAETIVGLTCAHVREDAYGQMTLHIPASLIKTGKSQLAVVQPELAAILHQRRTAMGIASQEPLVGHAVAKAHEHHRLTHVIARYCRLAKASIGGREVHSFRNTYTTLRTAMGTSTLAVMDEVGHTSANTTKRYAAKQAIIRNEIEQERWRAVDIAAIQAAEAHNDKAGPKEQLPLPMEGQLYLRRSLPRKTITISINGLSLAARDLPIEIRPPKKFEIVAASKMSDDSS